MKRVYGARDLTEAHFVKGLMEAEEIAAIVQGGPLQIVLGEIPVTPESLPSVWVADDDIPHAMQIIDDLRKGGPAATNPEPDWTCPKCGEVSEGQFTTCWKCGAERA
jgi:hypothetical protein